MKVETGLPLCAVYVRLRLLSLRLPYTQLKFPLIIANAAQFERERVEIQKNLNTRIFVSGIQMARSREHLNTGLVFRWLVTII